MKAFILAISLLLLPIFTFAQADTTKIDSTKKEIIIKDNWSKKKQNTKKTNKEIIIKSPNTKTNKRYEHVTNIGVGNKGLKIKEGQDTTIISIGNKELVISETRGNSKVRLRTKYRNRNKFRGHWAGFELGFSNFTKENYFGDDAYMDLEFNKSSAVNINFLQYDINLSKTKGNFGLVTGLGLSWYNFRFDKNISIKENETSGITEGYALSEDWDIKKSKLTMSFLTLPLLVEFQQDRFFLSAGIIAGLKLGSHTKIKYNNGGTHKKKKHDDFNLRPYKFDASVKIGFKGIHLWGSYGLCELFENGKGPELTPYAVGISFHVD